MFIRLFFSFVLLTSVCRAKELPVNFYSEVIRLEYDETMRFGYKLSCSDNSLKGFYEKLEESNYRTLLVSLKDQRASMRLNDWFYFVLVRESCKAFYENEEENKQVALCWFCLNKSGFNANIRYAAGNRLKLYVQTKSVVYLVDSYVYKKKKYTHLGFGVQEPPQGKNIGNLKYIPNNKGRCFDFSLGELTELPSSVKSSKEIPFTVNGRNDTLRILFNKTIIDMMSEYPFIDFEEYFTLGFSKASKQSLLPLLKERTKSLSKEEVVSYLLSFVRTGFEYEDDKVVYGREKPMIAEEVLYYPKADCEDKSALFLWLVRELLNLDMLVLEYPNHINIAVLLDKAYGKPMERKGVKYSVCETSVRWDNVYSGIGFSPKFEKYPNPKVIYEYHPNKK